ncbi:MAG: hypothetical protein GY856_33160, partial [bacterium]|nr:hypothetical protein [bacterium]
DDFCPRSHGYWKNHTELWPVDWLVLGGMEYDAAELYALLRYNGRDAASKLALQLVATKLNLVRGSDPRIDGLRSDNGPRTAPRQRLRPTAASEKPPITKRLRNQSSHARHA